MSRRFGVKVGGELRIGIQQVYRLPDGRKIAGPRAWGPWLHNRITNVGLDLLAGLVLGTKLFPVAVGVGIGTTAPADENTALENEKFRKRITRRIANLAEARIQTLIADDEANGFTLAEAGMFTSTVSGQGEMLSRITYDAIAKTSSIQITYEWRYPFARDG